MPDIPNKGRILRLLQYLYLNTDEEHAATTQDLINALAESGFKANRKTVKDDIDVMNNLGYDIVINVSSGNSFFLGDRTFELPELKLLIDAVSSSRFISVEKSQQLIDKIATLASVNQREQLIKRIYTTERIKPGSSKIYYIVDQLSVAIQSRKKVQFQYYEFDADKNKVFRNDGEIYINNPYGLFWSDDFYYLIGYSEKREKVVTFRVDRIDRLEILEENVIPEPEGFDITIFVREVFEMYECIKVSYSYEKSGIRGNKEKMREAFDSLYEQASKVLNDVRWSDYDDIVFISKSIGTVIASAFAGKYELNVKHVLYTPLSETFDFSPANSIAFIGTKDPWSDVSEVVERARNNKTDIHIFEDMNHSLECDDTLKNIEILSQVMIDTKQFLRG